MAVNYTTVFVDDLTGEPLGEDAVQVEFIWTDGKKRRLDLSPENHQALMDAMEPYLDNAQIVTGKDARKPIARRTRAKTGVKEIRAWARQNGYEVSDRGRIPDDVMEAYENSA